MVNEKLKVNRTLGFEIECGTNTDYDDMEVSHSECGYDGSITCGYSQTEVKTEPISDLNKLEDVYDEIKENYEMQVNNSCGLHIHVDINDFSVEERVKLLRFGKGIELLMFGLVDPSRCDWNDSCHKDDKSYNEYTRRLHYTWRKALSKKYLGVDDIDFSQFRHLQDFIQWFNNTKRYNNYNSKMWNGKYQWMNARTPYGTVEFRIFSSTTDHEVAQKFGMLAYHIVETVKNSTLKQLNFIIKSIYKASTVDEMYSRLFDSIGLDYEFRSETLNQDMVDHLDEKFCLPNRQAVAEAEDQAV